MSMWLMCVCVFLIFAGITFFVCFAMLGASKKRDKPTYNKTTEPTSQDSDPCDDKKKSDWFNTALKVIGTLVTLVVLAFLCLELRGCYRWLNKPSITQQTINPPQPVSECDTPCHMPTTWGQHTKSGGRPVLVKFYGKKDWIHLSGREDEHFTLDQFAVGEAQFASPPENNQSVHVQIYNP